MTLGQHSPGRDLKNRYLVVGAAMMVGLLSLVIGTYRLQVTRNEEFTAKSVDNFVKEVRLRADRGMIRDARGEILVDNRPSFDLFVTPAFCQKCEDEVLPRIAPLVGWDAEQVASTWQKVRLARRDAPFVPLPVKIDLTRDEVDTLTAHKRALPGVDVVAVPHRNYRTGTVLSHLLGYMNEINQEELARLNAKSASTPYFLGDFIGRRGLERYFEGKLRGTDGVRKEVVNARGESVPELAELIGEEATQPTPGQNVVLSIDMRLQAEAERAFPGTAGAVIAIDVKTGFIRAMVSRPGFDPNVLTGRVTPAQMSAMAKDPLQPMIFRPTQQHYSPGSTFKVLTTIAALKSGQFGAQSSVNCTGGYRLGARVWRCHKDSGHGIQDAKAALKNSCDTWYYRVADTIGLDPIAEIGRAFGLGQPTHIGMVAEVPGIMPSSAYHDKVTPGGYQKGMALNSAMGQGDVNVTPLQLAMVYAAIANGGTLHKPMVVERLEGVDGQVLHPFQPEVVRTVELSPQARQVLHDGMDAVANEPGGTAYRAARVLKGIKVAGKTGTAQVVRLGKVRLKTHQMDYFHRDHAWFAGYAPSDDPEIAIVVLNEHGGHGGADAAPTAMAVIQKYFDLKAEDAGAGVAGVTPPASPPAAVTLTPEGLPPTAPSVVAAAAAAEAALPKTPVTLPETALPPEVIARTSEGAAAAPMPAPSAPRIVVEPPPVVPPAPGEATAVSAAPAGGPPAAGPRVSPTPADAPQPALEEEIPMVDVGSPAGVPARGAGGAGPPEGAPAVPDDQPEVGTGPAVEDPAAPPPEE